jgi:hypothetical protein
MQASSSRRRGMGAFLIGQPTVHYRLATLTTAHFITCRKRGARAFSPLPTTLRWGMCEPRAILSVVSLVSLVTALLVQEQTTLAWITLAWITLAWTTLPAAPRLNPSSQN